MRVSLLSRLVLATAMAALCAMSGSSARAELTVQDLGAYLGVSWWETSVDLPSESYEVDVCEFTAGEIRSLIQIPKAWTKTPAMGLKILIGKNEGTYKVAVSALIGGTITAQTHTETFNHTMGSALPQKIQDGQFVLFGLPNNVESGDDLKQYDKGFLLRVRKN